MEEDGGRRGEVAAGAPALRSGGRWPSHKRGTEERSVGPTIHVFHGPTGSWTLSVVGGLRAFFIFYIKKKQNFKNICENFQKWVSVAPIPNGCLSPIQLAT